MEVARANTNSPAPAVLYIAGYGRSGSTILEMAIASCCRGFGAGEVNRIFEVYCESQQCECGAVMEQCQFWEPILSGLTQLDGLTDKAVTMQDLDRLTVCVEQSAGPQGNNYAAYTSVWTALFECLGDRADVIVDSSKTTRRSKFRVQALADMFGPNLHVIHLVRSPNGVLASALLGTNEDLEQGRRRDIVARAFRGVRTLIGWVIANRNARRIELEIGHERYRQLCYEEFTANTADCVQRILDWIGVEGCTVHLPAISRERGTLAHGVSGNRLRRKSDPEMLISTADQPDLTAIWRLLVRIIAGREARNYYGQN
jgi:hypothetical protein